MKRVLSILTIFYCAIASAATPYESMLEELWEKVSSDTMIESDEGFLCQDLKEFFKQAKGDALIFFFPKNCGFDRFVEKDGKFISMKHFFKLAKKYGYEVEYCSSQRHLVSFESRCEMTEFAREVFNSDLIDDEVPLYFPSRVIIAVLKPASFAE